MNTFTWLKYSVFTLLSCLCACAQKSNWKVDSISNRDSSFDSSKLCYEPKTHSPLHFELLRLNKKIESFLNLTQFRLKPFKEKNETIKASFTIEEELFEELLPILEGKMRVRLSDETTLRITQALQDGKKVGILIDGFEQTLEPDQFGPSFDLFLGN